jgi:hypothetical protein
MHEFYVHDKKLSTIAVVVMQFRENAGYKEQAFSLLKIFNILGFRWRKMRDNRRVLFNNKMVEIHVTLLERSLDFSKAVARLYVVSRHTSTRVV